jgi:alanine racemase
VPPGSAPPQLGPRLRARAPVNLAALERNCARLRRELTGGAELCAVVKADAYGHGALPCAHAALAGGATWLAVAAAGEAAALRAGGIEAPILVMGALTPAELEVALEARADVVAWREGFVAAAARVAGSAGARIHVKLDTGMGRLGTRDPEEATRVLEAAFAAPDLRAVGLMTHFATADARGDPFFGEQLERFRRWALPLAERHPDLLLHAANSAATLREPDSHLGLVRCGIAVYGMDPFGQDPAGQGLEPVLELRSWVAAVKPCAPGESAGYGRRFVAREATALATVPVGYGDGVRRALTGRADVLIGGRRHPLAGTVSMDNVTVDVGPGTPVRTGDEVVLLGRDGGERVLAEEWAERLGTINYEVTCGLTARVPRVHHRDGAPA